MTVKISFKGMCNGTQEKISTKTGNPYRITSFVAVGDDSMSTFEVFGDLGLKPNLVLGEYELEADVQQLGRVKVIKSPKPEAVK